MKKTFFSIIFSLTVFVYFSFGCSLAVEPYSKFNPTEYIFIGKVTGYTKNLKLPKSQRETAGLVVKVVESVNLPRTPASHFEILPYELGADCSTLPTAANELQKEFPIDTEVRVIAKEANILPSDLPKKNIRLEIRPGKLSSIVRNSYENGDRMTSAKSIFDYQTFVNPTPADYSEKFMPFLDAKYFLPEFELRKDVLRLEKSKVQSEKSQILKRLLYIPFDSFVSIYELFKKHAANKNEFQDLYYKRLFEIEGLSDEDYKLMEKTIPLKYRKKYKNNI